MQGACYRDGEKLVDHDVFVAAERDPMRGRTIGCIPVSDGKRLVGMITVSDLLDLLGRGVDRPAKVGHRASHHRVAHRKADRATGLW